MSNMMDNIIPGAEVVKSAARLGAEIKNIRLSDELSDEVIGSISQLLLEHKVIFFRDQGHLHDLEQQRFARRLGSRITLTTKQASIPEMAPDHRSGWADTDVSFGDVCPKISVLRGVVIPPDDRETVWSSTAAAYLDLPEALRMLADNLWAVYSAYDCTVSTHSAEMDTNQFDDVFTGTICENARPIVRIHPETGERLLVLADSVQSFVGLEKYASQKLFERLRSYLTARENSVRWSWKSGDVVIWDNRAAQRYAILRNRLERPTAIDGDASLSIAGPGSLARAKSKPQAARAA